MTTQPKLTAAQRKERRATIERMVAAMATSTIMNEVLDKTDGLYTRQLVRIAVEITNEIERVTA
ncbi:hypothetical protein J7E70_07985 [Variovorax paradoxus]|nr:hypothetical protein [Variovorax paradoxus]MBT2300403.1 hypothetical protein [Variovorax paradoxus]